jgi:hypothetical protein
MYEEAKDPAIGLMSKFIGVRILDGRNGDLDRLMESREGPRLERVFHLV